MPDIKSNINQHNKKIIPNSETNQNIRTCNCISKQQFPLNQQCLTLKILYTKQQLPQTYKINAKNTTLDSATQHSKCVIQTTKNHCPT